ncbi:MAG TPA: glucose-1-phosphate adenylyltransferase subunit GlgD [Pseudothermotoga sp.]|nr:glucose-1-phosphate adenylyltransferase subunit GlgD [Pseudothermotoga sp.]HOK83913.1 glucose-1-phosphate adenylyltransferase subunit GlgD [Pseudothermotoga sp.]HPP70701.1 glucose-1-phosphate adenylyltransferase subunit GlgD [Pseudothermotoga sp.]
MRILGLILAGGQSKALGSLVSKRASAALPVFGKYRAIDFTLSNMVNAGIRKVGVLTQYNPRSLMDHLGSGKEWDLDRKNGGLFLLQPYVSQEGYYWYKGTADAIFQNMTLLRRGEEDYVLIGSGDHIYKIDFSQVFEFHISNGADITLLVKEMDETYDLSQYGIVEMSGNRIIDIEEKPEKPKTNVAFLGIYFMNKYFLMELLYNYVTKGETDLLTIIQSQLDRLKVCGYLFNGYWRNVKKGINEYFRINMDGLKKEVRGELFYRYGKIYTKLKDLPPPKIGGTAIVRNSILSDGCIVNGNVENSILFRGVNVKAGAVVENSVVMQDTVIEEGAVVRNAVLDKEVLIRQESRLVGKDTIAVLEKRAVL